MHHAPYHTQSLSLFTSYISHHRQGPLVLADCPHPFLSALHFTADTPLLPLHPNVQPVRHRGPTETRPHPRPIPCHPPHPPLPSLGRQRLRPRAGLNYPASAATRPAASCRPRPGKQASAPHCAQTYGHRLLSRPVLQGRRLHHQLLIRYDSGCRLRYLHLYVRCRSRCLPGNGSQDQRRGDKIIHLYNNR